MKSSLMVGILGALILTFGGPCFAVGEEVTILWDYFNPPTDLAGFELRVNEDNSTMIEVDPDQRAWAGALDLVDDENLFELRAKDLAGQVSAWSDVGHDPVPGDPHITCITVQSR